MKNLVVFISLVKILEDRRVIHVVREEAELASASLEEDLVAAVVFCCGTLGFSRPSHGQRSWVRIPDPDPDPAVLRVSYPRAGPGLPLSSSSASTHCWAA